MGEYEFRTKSVTVQAVRFTGENWLEMGRFCGATLNDATEGQPYKMTGGDWNVRVIPREGRPHAIEPQPASLMVETLKGPSLCFPGDWLIRGTLGELYPVKPEVFEDKYERIATIMQPEHVIVFAPDARPNMRHPQGCDVGACAFTAASMKMPLSFLEPAMHGSWTCFVSGKNGEELILKDKIA